MRYQDLTQESGFGPADFHPSWVDGSHTTVATEDLFAGLDGSELTVADVRWHIEVFSITEDAVSRWIQLGVSGPAEHTTTLRLDETDGPSDVCRMLSAWLSDRVVTNDCV